MSHTPLFDKNWLDLVFDGKNKAYGAYQLRLENPRTTVLAMFYGLLFLATASGGIMLLSSFDEVSVPEITDLETIIRIENVYTPKAPVEKPVQAVRKTQKQTLKDNKQDLVNPEVVEHEQAQEIRTNVETQNAAPENQGSETGIEGKNPTEGASAGGPPTETKSNEPLIPATLDRQPAYPGGIQSFYTKVGSEFEKPEMTEAQNVRIIVSFVVETDGSMTDIKVLNNPGSGLQKEAVRVLKSIRKRWEPGVKNGQAVRTLFTLPIVIKAE